MKTRTLPSVGAAWLLAILAAGQASAQEGGAKPGVPPPKRRTDGGPVFAPPEPAPEPEEKPKEPEAPPLPASDSLDGLIAALATWPSHAAKAAAETLAGRWAEAKPRVHELLRKPSPEGRGAAGAAAALRLSGDPEGIPALLGALRDTRNFRWCGEILEGVVALDPVGAKERLFPLLSVPSAIVVERVAKALQPLLGAADMARLREAFGSRIAATRRAALGMAAELDFAGVREDLVVALGDRAPDVAAAAAFSLGARTGPEGWPALNAVARGDDPRRSAYAVLALLSVSDRAASPLDDASVAGLLGSRGLQSADPLGRTMAAVALAELGYRRPDPRVNPLLESEVVPALLEVVAGNRFFPDLTVLRPYVVTGLRRLCPGTENLQTAPDWAKWWEGHAAGFVARRALLALPAAVRGDLRVRVEGKAAGAAGPCTYAAVLAEVPASGGAGGRFVALDRGEIDRIAAAAEASGVLGMSEGPGEGSEPPALEILVEAGKRGRSVRLPAGAVPGPGIVSLIDTLAAVREANLWQRYWDHRAAPTFAEFVHEERPFWTGKPSAEERSARRVRLIVGALREMGDEEDRVEALRRLAAEPALRAALRPPEADALASLAALSRDFSQTAEHALLALAAAGRSEGLSLLRARIEAAREDGERSIVFALLEDTLRSGPPEPVFDAADGRFGLPVRCAAVRALGGREDRTDARVVDAVRRAVAATEPEVRSAGYVALGRLRAEGAVAVLAEAVRIETDAAARAGALEALGIFGGTEVVPVLGRAVHSPDARVRSAAVRALGAAKQPEGLTYLLAALTADSDPAVRVEADRAVRALGGDRAREALRAVAQDRRRDAETRSRAVEGLGLLGAAASQSDLRALLADPEPDVADAAAFALAWIRDGDAAPRVLEALRAGRAPGRALQCIELLSLEAFPTARDRAEAVALYTGWFEVSGSRGPRGWLVEALAARGLGDDSLRDFESGVNARAAVPVLLRASKDAPWHLRRAVNLELQRISGKNLGDIDPWTPASKGDAVAAAWAAWWERESGAKR